MNRAQLARLLDHSLLRADTIDEDILAQAEALALLGAGANRLGTSASRAILAELPAAASSEE